MIGAHPKVKLAAVSATAGLAALLSGCHHPSTASNNPFLAPTRVPPPSTRPIAPGTAQPYYPGDPLPVMQSAVPAENEALGALAAKTASEPKPLTAANEPTVIIPRDDENLRFALPPPPPVPAQQSVVAAAQTSPAQAANVPAPPAAQAQAVVPAMYTAPASGADGAIAAPAATPAESAAAGPWRSPSIAAPAPPAIYQPATPTNTTPALPTAFVPSPVVGNSAPGIPPSTEVSLRVVPSPEVSASPTPRIRIPGYPAPDVTMTAVPSTTVSSADGFRPRSSMR